MTTRPYRKTSIPCCKAYTNEKGDTRSYGITLYRAGRIWSPVAGILPAPSDPPLSLAPDILSGFPRCRSVFGSFNSAQRGVT